MPVKNSIDTSRHAEVFNPVKFNPRVHIIGSGATGTHAIYHLAKLGINRVDAYDFDFVEAHNLANQMFFKRHIGMQKVDAISSFINENMEQDIVIPHDLKVESEDDLDLSNEGGDVVFVLTDTIQSRKDIIEFLELTNAGWVIETRMAVSHHETYTFRPNNPEVVQAWVETLPGEDDYVEVSACGSSLSVGATADNLATTAVWQMVHALNNPGMVDFKRGYSLRDGESSLTPSLTPSKAVRL